MCRRKKKQRNGAYRIVLSNLHERVLELQRLNLLVPFRDHVEVLSCLCCECFATHPLKQHFVHTGVYTVCNWEVPLLEGMSMREKRSLPDKRRYVGLAPVRGR